MTSCCLYIATLLNKIVYYIYTMALPSKNNPLSKINKMNFDRKPTFHKAIFTHKVPEPKPHPSTHNAPSSTNPLPQFFYVFYAFSQPQQAIPPEHTPSCFYATMSLSHCFPKKYAIINICQNQGKFPMDIEERKQKCMP